MVYVSENVTSRLLEALQFAEASALGIEFEKDVSNDRLGIPNEVTISPSIASQNPDITQTDDIDLSNQETRGR